MDKLIELLEKYYYRVLGLFIGYAILIVILFSIETNIVLISPEPEYRVLVYGLILGGWSLIWFLSRNYMPRTTIGKIGIVIAIDAENEKQKTRVKVDFAQRLKQMLNQNNLSSLFEIIVLSDYRSLRASKILREYSELNDELKRQARENESIASKLKEFRNWKKFHSKIRGHFFIWGDIKERKDQGDKYFLNLDGLVTHRPVDPSAGDKIKQEFMSIFPKEISFYENFEMKGFRFTADYIYLTARYITGIAALISGDPVTALMLHDGLKKEIDSFSKPLLPNLVHVSKQLDKVILSEKHLIARHDYYIRHNVSGARRFISECLNQTDVPYEVLIFSSYIAFKEDRNPIESLKLLNRASKKSGSNFLWLYNKAFLFMYLGKFEKGSKAYKKISKLTFSNEDKVVDECIEFNRQLLQSEPDKIQSLFIIGYLYLRKKLNFPLALEFFERFRDEATTKKGFDVLLNSTSSYLNEIEEQMPIKPDE